MNLQEKKTYKNLGSFYMKPDKKIYYYHDEKKTKSYLLIDLFSSVIRFIGLFLTFFIYNLFLKKPLIDIRKLDIYK